MKLREIKNDDNSAIAEIIRAVMTEYGADPKTTVLGEPVLDTMFENYQLPRCIYFVAEINGEIAGGCGIAPLEGSSDNTCELQRMFLKKETRGKGTGKALLEACLHSALEFGYAKMYIESFSNMDRALRLYKAYGFRPLAGPLGSTGHTGCNVHMALELTGAIQKRWPS
jgi:putative acetyltransferase